MVTATAAPTATLEEAAAQLKSKRAALDALQQQLETATQEVESLKALREKFLIPASAGDKAATEHVEELERRQQAVSRKIEGLQLRLQPAEREFREVETEHIRLAGEIAQEEMRKRLERIDAETLRQADNILAHWRAACRASYELCEYVGTNVEANPEMTERQKTDRIVKVRELLRGPNLSIESWEQNRRPALRMNLPIRSMRAAESLRHLEELQ